MKRFDDIKKGQKLWSIQLGTCYVRNIYMDSSPHNKIVCENTDGDTYSYGLDGVASPNHRHPSLYFHRISEKDSSKSYPKMMQVWNNSSDKKSEVIIYFELCGKYYGGRSSEEAGIVSYKDNPSVRITKWNFAEDIIKKTNKISMVDLAKHFGVDEVEILEQKS